jgi:hypothetical protein
VPKSADNCGSSVQNVAASVAVGRPIYFFYSEALSRMADEPKHIAQLWKMFHSLLHMNALLELELTATQLVLEAEGRLDATAVARQKAILREQKREIFERLEATFRDEPPDTLLELLRRFEGPPQ